VKIAIVIAALALGILLLGSTVQNEGCLPWQQRVSYGGSRFDEQRGVSRCSGSWLPFGSALLSLPHQQSEPLVRRELTADVPNDEMHRAGGALVRQPD
jgi:hypothetical protein